MRLRLQLLQVATPYLGRTRLTFVQAGMVDRFSLELQGTLTVIVNRDDTLRPGRFYVAELTEESNGDDVHTGGRST